MNVLRTNDEAGREPGEIGRIADRLQSAATAAHDRGTLAVRGAVWNALVALVDPTAPVMPDIHKLTVAAYAAADLADTLPAAVALLAERRVLDDVQAASARIAAREQARRAWIGVATRVHAARTATGRAAA